MATRNGKHIFWRSIQMALKTSLRIRCFSDWLMFSEYHFVRRDLPWRLIKKKQWIICLNSSKIIIKTYSAITFYKFTISFYWIVPMINRKIKINYLFVLSFNTYIIMAWAEIVKNFFADVVQNILVKLSRYGGLLSPMVSSHMLVRLTSHLSSIRVPHCILPTRS